MPLGPEQRHHHRHAQSTVVLEAPFSKTSRVCSSGVEGSEQHRATSHRETRTWGQGSRSQDQRQSMSRGAQTGSHSPAKRPTGPGQEPQKDPRASPPQPSVPQPPHRSAEHRSGAHTHPPQPPPSTLRLGRRIPASQELTRAQVWTPMCGLGDEWSLKTFLRDP